MSKVAKIDFISKLDGLVGGLSVEALAKYIGSKKEYFRVRKLHLLHDNNENMNLNQIILNNFERLKGLEELSLDFGSIFLLSENFKLSKLERFYFKKYRYDENHSLIKHFWDLKFHERAANIRVIKVNMRYPCLCLEELKKDNHKVFYNLRKLQTFHFSGSFNFACIHSNMSTSFNKVNIIRDLININSCYNLKYLEFWHIIFKESDIIIDLPNLESFILLDARGGKSLTFKNTRNLNSLSLKWLEDISEIFVEEIQSLVKIDLEAIMNIKFIFSLRSAIKLKKMRVHSCPKISSIETLQNAINLEEFEYLQGNIYDLSYLEGLNKLKKVTIGLNDDYIELINVPKHLEDIIYHQRRT